MSKILIILFALIVSTCSFGLSIYAFNSDQNLFAEIDEYFDPIAEYEPKCILKQEQQYGKAKMINDCQEFFGKYCLKPLENLFVAKGIEKMKDRCFGEDVRQLLNEIDKG